jgi:farnesyl-diphosphate farnesyltransferase
MADFDNLLMLTSRTFGLSIPLLEEPHRRRLTLAYLLFRVADTLEDAENLPRSERVNALLDLRRVLSENDRVRAEKLGRQWVAWRPSTHAGYLELLAAFPELTRAIDDLEAPGNQMIVRHVCRTIDGMLEFVGRSNPSGNLQLETRDELLRYCYAVAGIVGELITELFVTSIHDLQPVAADLQRLAAKFGEGLQLVNILRDASEDAHYGRIYLPKDVSHEEVFELARQDLDAAEAYVTAVRRCGTGDGVVPFLEFPLRLAMKTLDSVQSEGPGAKLTRHQVADILRQIDGRFRTPESLPLSLKGYGA